MRSPASSSGSYRRRSTPSRPDQLASAAAAHAPRPAGADPARLNPGGGAIAIGHPLGASGARLMTALVHHMTAEGIQYGLQTMCEGGGMANATIIERIA